MRSQALQERSDIVMEDEFFSWSRAVHDAERRASDAFLRHCVLRYADKWMVCRYADWSDRA